MRRLALLALLLAGRASAQIVVTSATYGSNVPTVTPGNATAAVATQCNGTTNCSYIVWYYNFLPDPAPGKAKAFSASWTCNGSPFQTFATPTQPNGESGYGAIATLSCTTPPTPTPTPLPSGTQILKWKVTYTCKPPFKSCQTTPWTNVMNYQIVNSEYPGVTATIEILP